MSKTEKTEIPSTGRVSLADKVEARKRLDALKSTEKSEELEKKNIKAATGKEDTEPTEREYKWNYPADVKGDADKMKKFRTKYRKSIRDLKKKVRKAEKELKNLVDAGAPADKITAAQVAFDQANTECTEVCNRVLPDPARVV